MDYQNPERNPCAITRLRTTATLVLSPVLTRALGLLSAEQFGCGRAVLVFVLTARAVRLLVTYPRVWNL